MKRTWKFSDKISGQILLSCLEIADHYGARLTGLWFKPKLEAGRGLLLVPCSSIHTFLMTYPIDAVWISREGEVLKVTKNLVPWRTAFGPGGTHAVLELQSGGSENFRAGMRLKLEKISDAGPELPKNLRFLS